MRCKACNELLLEYELKHDDELCLVCLAISCEAAYEDNNPLLFIKKE